MTEFYPGSSQPIRPTSPAPSHSEWGRSKTFTINGSEMELFTIGELAEKLNRSPVTIRRWERAGIIPKATFKKSGKDVHGKRRFYSKAQIVGLVEIAAEAGILDNPHVNISTTFFREKALALFMTLKTK